MMNPVKINPVTLCSSEEFNKLSGVKPASNAVGSSLEQIFASDIAKTFYEHNFTKDLLICLNHRHYSISKDEKTVTKVLNLDSKESLEFDKEFNELKLKNSLENIDLSENKDYWKDKTIGFISGPYKSNDNNNNNNNSNLIGYKWKIREDKSGFECYEFLDKRNLINFKNYEKMAEKFESDLNFQLELINKMSSLEKKHNIDFSKYLGVMLPHDYNMYYKNSVSIELNIEIKKKSKLLFIKDNKDFNFKNNPFYKKLSQYDTIQTGWSFNGTTKIKCNSHCISVCGICFNALDH